MNKSDWGLVRMLSISYTDRNFRLEFALSPATSATSENLIVQDFKIEAPKLPANAPEEEQGGTLGASGDHQSQVKALQAEQTERAYSAILRKVGTSAVDLFPPNRVHAWCASCGEGVARSTGYKHHKIGVKKVFCANCHHGHGLPLREVAV